MNKQNKLVDTTEEWLPEEKGSGGRIKRVKGVKYMVAEGYQTLGGEHNAVYR